MKKFLILIFIFCQASDILPQEYWQQVPSPTTKWFYDSHLLDTLYGWASGDSGLIAHTSNGGQNWVLQNSGIDLFPIEKIFFINRNLGWALANDFLFFGTIILRTTNGGANWTNYRFYDTTVVMNALYFHDSLNGFLSGYTGKILRTTNSGINWVECSVDTLFCPFLYTFPKLKFSFLNSQTGFVCGGQRDIQGMVWRTTDSGLNWLTYCVSAEPLYDIKAIDQNRVITCGGDPEFGNSIAHSYDGGATWSNVSQGFFGTGQSLAFRTPSELWIPLAFGQSWAVSLDSGNANAPWQIIGTTDSVAIYSAGFVTPTYGWAFAFDGTILKYNKDVIGISSNQNIINNNYSLFQNYPNPFNPATIISYYLAKPEFVKITIYDLLGREINQVLEGIRPAGLNKYKFVNINLATGVYIYKITAGDFIETRKMVIIK